MSNLPPNSTGYIPPDLAEGAHQEVYRLARESPGPQTAWEGLEAFSAAVDWKEPWIRKLLCAHVAMFVVTIGLRKRFGVQVGLFGVVCVCVGAAERLNGLAAQHWREFSGQDYFDEHGVFAAVMWCGPLLVLATFQLCNFLALAGGLLVTAKRAELAENRRGAGAGAPAKANKAGAGAGAGGAVAPGTGEGVRKRRSRRED